MITSIGNSSYDTLSTADVLAVLSFIITLTPLSFWLTTNTSFPFTILYTVLLSVVTSCVLSLSLYSSSTMIAWTVGMPTCLAASKDDVISTVSDDGEVILISIGLCKDKEMSINECTPVVQPDGNHVTFN